MAMMGVAGVAESFASWMSSTMAVKVRIGNSMAASTPSATSAPATAATPATPATLATLQLQEQLSKLEDCPIQFTPMLEPVRVVHEDEESRVGQPPHVLDFQAARRWLLAEESGAVCPFCRRRVIGVESHPSQALSASLQQLAGERYSRGEVVAHKAVRLLDAQLLSAFGRALPAEEWRRQLLLRNDAGQLPFELLGEVASGQDVISFLQELDLELSSEGRGPAIVRSVPSAKYAGGCEFWSVADPARPRPLRAGDELPAAKEEEADRYHLLSVLPARLFEQDVQHAETIALLLRTSEGGSISFVGVEIQEATCGRAGGICDVEVFEPAIGIRLAGDDSTAKHFSAQLAASSGLWIGGAEHFDDFHVPSAPSAAAWLSFDGGWRLQPAAAGINIENIEGTNQDIADGCMLPHDGEVVARILPGGQQLSLSPCFVARRYVPAEAHGAAQVSMAKAEQSMQCLAFVKLSLEIRDECGALVHCSEWTRAVRPEITIGRLQAASLMVPMLGRVGATVSRCHCVLRLLPGSVGCEESDGPGKARLEAYDAGSLGGTRLRGARLGGAAHAQPVVEGDCLELGCATIRLLKISRVMRAGDHQAVGAFLESLTGQPEDAPDADVHASHGMWTLL
eukprot:gb/GFBE01077174.1/.p1 GENE.gb/GFBE01077174.1/~~gb/GFBE01077174.1/.p1  ORF type:complete len:626 (+),score=110.85 gb/GFBE01077174.1/:1-1878(+)